MLEIQGKYNTAKVFTYNIESSAMSQIHNLLNQSFAEGSKIRIMPDVHAGAGCTIGTTMTITDKVVPNMVGVDIGCGMETVRLKDKHIELSQLDKAIHKYIPAGFSIRDTPHHYADMIDLTELRCAKHMRLDRAALSVGTLGGGNHFIELGKAKAVSGGSDDVNDALFLVVHSGSRNIGNMAAEWYQKKAIEDLKKKKVNIERSLAYAEGALMDDYLHDMAILQRYAEINRKAIIKELEKRVGFKVMESFTTTHNYIDLDSRILRKGAISAKKGEKVLIPMNMRDGSLICLGKGNPDWNSSAPHGAGRIMSRSTAKEKITLTQFEAAMEGIYSTTVSRKTIDEAPFAYKPMEEITEHIGDTVEILAHITPIYNFKAAE
ncbi:MAG: RtcB family protein [Defluviitaleaceae bacterium]|nr:RtcB family protein [Defluviitaleaceae bacterium]